MKGATELLDLLVETAEFQSTLPVKGATLYPKHNFSCLSFQSTLPVKGATNMFLLIYSSQNISIHAPREGSDVGKTMPRIDTLISIHAPREGSDCDSGIKTNVVTGFQSTLPVKGATTSANCYVRRFNNFNPRSP